MAGFALERSGICASLPRSLTAHAWGFRAMVHKGLHDRIDVGFAWDLVERFSAQPREKPADANRGAEIIAERLEMAGAPVTMHELKLFLSLPGSASIEVAGKRFNAKPPAFSAI